MAADPDSRWASINANHMLPSGSSLFHPHLQGIVDSQPTTLQRMLAEVPSGRLESYLRAERREGQRHLGDTGRVEWVAMFLERLHWEGAVDLAPETVAQRIGERLRA